MRNHLLLTRISRAGRSILTLNRDREYAALKRMLELKPTDTVLDAGCGDGFWTSRIAKYCGHVTGLEPDQRTIGVAQALYSRSNVTYMCGVGESLPFGNGAFDKVLSVSCLEHFADPQHGIAEMARVLKPGGRAIVGVPNRHDPFLRPLLATVLQALGLYAYGYERSYSRRALRAVLQRAGFTVVAETAILFIPGWLRMLDLACHSWCRPLAAVTGALVRPFVFLDRYVPAVRRHGYLLATVVMKPARRG